MTRTKSCLQIILEMLFVLKTPQIPELLRTQRRYGIIGVLPGTVPLQVHIGHVLLYIVVTGTHQYLLEI